MQLVIFITEGDMLLSGFLIPFCQHGFHTCLHFLSQQFFLLFELLSQFVETLLIFLVDVHELILFYFF